jgi:hypothetical protein
LNGLTRGVCVLAGLAAFCWIAFQHVRTQTTPPLIPGWEDLLSCYDVASLDGTTRITFSEDHSIHFYGDNSANSASDTWSFDTETKHYVITLKGQSTTYSRIVPAGANICMLVKGSIDAADLRGSWFAFSPDNDDYQDSSPYDR